MSGDSSHEISGSGSATFTLYSNPAEYGTEDFHRYFGTEDFHPSFGTEDFTALPCDTGYLDVTSVSPSQQSSVGSGDFVTNTDTHGPVFGTPRKTDSGKSGRAAGLGDTIFFSGDILGHEPRTQAVKFETPTPWKTSHHMIIGTSRNVMWFPKTAYNPTLYASRYPQHNNGIPRAIIVERMRRWNMSWDVAQLLHDRNIVPNEFYIPQVTFQGTLFFVNRQISKECCLPNSPRKPHQTANSDPTTLDADSSDFDGEISSASSPDWSDQGSAENRHSAGDCFDQPDSRGRELFHLFPLDMFDNQMYEVRTPDEWIRLGVRHGVQYAVPAKAFLRHLHRGDEHSSNMESRADGGDKPQSPRAKNQMADYWEDVGVRSYDAETAEYTVSPVNRPDECYRLPRIYICFSAENPVNFAERVKDAIQARKQSRSQLEYNLFIASIPLDVEALPKLDEASVDSIIVNIARGNPDAIPMEKQQQLRTQVENLHAQSVSKEIHRFNRQNKDKSGLFHGIMSWLDEEFHAKLPEEPRQPSRSKRGTVDTGGSRNDFLRSLKIIRTKFLFTQRPIIDAMGVVIEKCQEMAEESFFLFDTPPLTLQDFQEAQSLQIAAIMTIIKGEWYDSIIEGLLEYFTKAGTWYNVDVDNWSVYQCSKLSVFITLVKFHMESCIRSTVTKSCTAFADYLAKACRSHDSRDSLETEHPIFLITLSISAEEGPHYTTPLEAFETTLQAIYAKPIDACHRIDQLEPRMLTKFKFPKDMYLSSLGFMEENATVPQEKLRAALHVAVSPLRDYAKQFEQYVEFYKLDVDQSIQEFTEANHPAVEVKDIIADHLAYLEKLENEIPDNVIMEPFLVDITDLKSHLVDKCRDLCDGICGSFENRLSSMMREAMLTYEYWYATLCESHQAVEKYMELVNKLDTIPALVQEQDKNIRVMQQDYEILDFFKVLMKETSLSIKYEALVWPYRIKTKLDNFIDKIEQELDKFRRIQTKDEVTLQEKLSSIFSWFTQLVEQQDMDKVHEFGNEFRRAWKQLNEIDDYGKLLNMRQDLLKLPVTPFDQTKDLKEQFEPYKDFWTTASDFQKMLQQWTERPLAQLDLATIEPTFNDMFETINKCEEKFKSIQPDMLTNVDLIKENMKKFQDNTLPILNILMNPNFQPKHWEEFGNAIGYANFLITEKTSLDKFLKMSHVRDNLDLLKKINERVNRECNEDYTEEMEEAMSPLESLRDLHEPEDWNISQPEDNEEHATAEEYNIPELQDAKSAWTNRSEVETDVENNFQ
ncbi:hypothetical protein M8J76_008111 [Diaphorina citri]|nr:hypothetical protein M8J76_008111 [Diaphorina citri]